jgi:diguanylate cyclase (GGDEF)-like protein/PAS domain S-box-containing protein
MKDQSKTKQVLIQELVSLRHRISELERSESELKRAVEVLKDSESKYQFLAENMADVVFAVDLNLMTTYVSPSIGKLLGYTPQERLAQKKEQQLTLKSQKLIFETLSVELDREKEKGSDPDRSKTLELEYYHKDGSIKHLLTYVRGIRDSEGNLTGFYGSSHDITDRKRMEEAYKDSEFKYRSLIEHSSDVVFCVDQNGEYKFVNQVFASTFGKTPDYFLGKTFWDIYPKEHADQRQAVSSMVFATGESQSVEVAVPLPDRTLYFIAKANPVRDETGKVVLNLTHATDITERKKMEEALRESEKRYRELSIIDDLTQLYNSRHFYAQLKNETERSNRYGQPLTLMLIDLDNFKAFNDSYGHIEGDQVLMRLGQVMKRCLRETDSAYRYGGEEFTILLPMTASGEGVITAERIRTEFRKETFFPVPGQEVHMMVSIGLAQYRTKEEMKAFVHRVDQLMYRVKENGKDGICSEP